MLWTLARTLDMYFLMVITTGADYNLKNADGVTSMSMIKSLQSCRLCFHHDEYPIMHRHLYESIMDHACKYNLCEQCL